MRETPGQYANRIPCPVRVSDEVGGEICGWPTACQGGFDGWQESVRVALTQPPRIAHGVQDLCCGVTRFGWGFG
ncbi:hypothetical protein MSHO_59180 [Mycobacterium shottsii]|uniref:Uncharacterized protein n=1 Tax=Mycobacterium shottsii TaxID=133549 RepID=A0A7I7LMG4_9MYCO|nr:hypothetical protein [Mycobacterium shottsii]BBX60573.1 hypothetical protein MSHO_59180 [Mycobacterium shottsii]